MKNDIRSKYVTWKNVFIVWAHFSHKTLKVLKVIEIV